MMTTDANRVAEAHAVIAEHYRHSRGHCAGCLSAEGVYVEWSTCEPWQKAKATIEAEDPQRLQPVRQYRECDG